MRKALLVFLMIFGQVGQLGHAQSKVAYDPRTSDPEPKPTAQEEKMIRGLADAAARKNMWQDENKMEYCSGNDFTIQGIAPGPFLQPNTQEVLYLYTYCFNRQYNMLGLVLVRNGKVVQHHLLKSLYFKMLALKDINRNGVREFLLWGGFTGTGTSEDWVTIFEYRKNIPTQLWEFEVGQDDCSGFQKGKNVNVLKVVPGKIPKFSFDQYRGKCEGKLTLIKSGAQAPDNPYGHKVEVFSGPLKATSASKPKSKKVFLEVFLQQMGNRVIQRQDPDCQGSPSVRGDDATIERVMQVMSDLLYMRNPQVPLGYVSLEAGSFLFVPDQTFRKVCVQFFE
ncbi:hypothetical protein [Deinococcus roseus]|uniref:Uncharacterized protein n=1 Tax=Deinococcus roseus TaxID=392414 RepID=A0ABQ2DHW2_9DEIO|nr:hypothetical protein [Deinococcus roseus]GGJ58665.1 hypothetical protein GCM10008938_50990 [Deinococcus roseus]